MVIVGVRAGVGCTPPTSTPPTSTLPVSAVQLRRWRRLEEVTAIDCHGKNRPSWLDGWLARAAGPTESGSGVTGSWGGTSRRLGTDASGSSTARSRR